LPIETHIAVLNWRYSYEAKPQVNVGMIVSTLKYFGVVDVMPFIYDFCDV
jgi:hypothetical protein